MPSKAIPLFEATLERVRSTLGEDHGDTLTIMDNLAVASQCGRPARSAIWLHKTAIRGFTATVGADHLTTLVAINNLARAYQNSGQLDGIDRALCTWFWRNCGRNSVTTILRRCRPAAGLARSYQLDGQGDRAIDLYESTVNGRRAKLGPDHPDTLLCTLELARAYVGRWPE